MTHAYERDSSADMREALPLDGGGLGGGEILSQHKPPTRSLRNLLCGAPTRSLRSDPPPQVGRV